MDEDEVVTTASLSGNNKENSSSGGGGIQKLWDQIIPDSYRWNFLFLSNRYHKWLDIIIAILQIAVFKYLHIMILNLTGILTTCKKQQLCFGNMVLIRIAYLFTNPHVF